MADAKLIRQQDEESRNKSVRFGIGAIICSIVAVGLAALAALLLSLFTGGDKAAVLLFIFTIGGILLCGGGALLLLLNALIRVIAQMSINRNAVSWISLTVFILCVAGCALMFVVFS